jgi:hypothetical protein
MTGTQTWHAFRRGLGTRLNEVGVDGKTIQSILRHADISTTQAYYIYLGPEAGCSGLEEAGQDCPHKIWYQELT